MPELWICRCPMLRCEEGTGVCLRVTGARDVHVAMLWCEKRSWSVSSFYGKWLRSKFRCRIQRVQNSDEQEEFNKLPKSEVVGVHIPIDDVPEEVETETPGPDKREPKAEDKVRVIGHCGLCANWRRSQTDNCIWEVCAVYPVNPATNTKHTFYESRYAAVPDNMVYEQMFASQWLQICARWDSRKLLLIIYVYTFYGYSELFTKLSEYTY
jgi:hypothetical protein